MSAIDVKNLVKKFHGQTVLHGIDLEVEQGEVVAIIGPSGSGKRRCCAVLTCLNSRKAAPFGLGISRLIPGNPSASRKG
jgi:cystine transport system ATP-binding protein